MNVFTQDARLGRLTTVLGSDALVLLRMDGTEELSGDFEWRVEALSTQNTPALASPSVHLKHSMATCGKT